MNCEHKETKRGKNAPRRWGSYQTQVCTSCGAYRFHHHDGRIARPEWHPASEYEGDIAEQELD